MEPILHQAELTAQSAETEDLVRIPRMSQTKDGNGREHLQRINHYHRRSGPYNHAFQKAGRITYR